MKARRTPSGSLGSGTVSASPSQAFTHLLVLAVTLACLLPFLAKPFHVDDPLFIWTARQIASHPLDFYGFPVNWYGTVMRMADVMQNPPLTSYYLAATAGPFGFQEWAVHFALLVPALLAASGTFALARRFCSRPWVAALAAVLTPVFAISATTAMSDVWMVALWVWATERWIAGIDSGRAGVVVLASALATLAVLAKYSALCLLPLLWLYALLHRSSWKLIASGIALPLAALACYQLGTARLYGHGLLFAGARYAIDVRFQGGGALFTKTLTGLSFTGGCLLTPLALASITASRRVWIAAGAGVLVVAAISTQIAPWRAYLADAGGHWRWGSIAQLSLFVALGAFAVGLVLTEIAHKREDSGFLAAWVLGVFAFTCYLNWTINARSLLPMAPAIAILAVRRLERPPGAGDNRVRGLVIAALVLGAALCLGLEAADDAEARSARDAAQHIGPQLQPAVPALLFQGHWGFQYYMEQLGATALDLRRLDSVPGNSAIVVPLRNTNVTRLPDRSFPVAQRIDFPSSRVLTTLDDRLGAGFYSDVYGPLPFVAAAGQPDPYLVLFKVAP